MARLGCGGVLALAALSSATWGCSDRGDPPLGSARHEVTAPLRAAYCEADVEGIGLVDVETDYLPRVITCENGGADLEALKAQAIAARSVLYYALETAGSICDSQGCQVYSCAAEPLPIHHQAVDETSGLYLSFNATLTYGFYVAGDDGTSPPDCVGDPDVGTEHWVTYNQGRSGADVEQTDLGFVFDPDDVGYGQNRGCMGQWGARCLEASYGYAYRDILEFYYGDDIGLIKAAGPCVLGGEGGAGGAEEGSGGEAGVGGFVGGLGGGGASAEDDDVVRADASCACRAAPARAPGGWAALWLVVAWWVRRRGRQQLLELLGRSVSSPSRSMMPES